ncbi:hypothetical protein [Streptomyces sp. SP18CS02]|uniref:hypothetical protein n=1 Tax=Streptomyces sp. SP18CS02 TaxID=3002531 RepID=UPI002E786486|nr:hypothetical protein [Streptomyces sp. SP18CS02]MEE1752745.1 hypothetical protein [Streptomyces sp. SP18CS02]
MRVRLQTNHGEYLLADDTAKTLGALLRQFGIPLSAVWTYRTTPLGDGRRQADFLPSTTTGDGEEEVIARISRNINIPGLLGHETTSVRPVENASSEWTFPSPDGGAFQRVVAQMTAEECLAFVKQSVARTLEAWPQDVPHGVVVGTSGGGDSNALLSAMIESGRFEPSQVRPVMMLGIPDWDTQVDNARQLCGSLGTELRVVDEAEAADLCGIRGIADARDHFLELFPDADLEFLGTWLLRRVLSACARQAGVQAVALGANREDIVAEHLSRLVRGLMPLPAPYRRIGDVLFTYPMWQVPKKIGDGVYPSFSLENYEARNASFSPGRSVFYYFSYWMSELLPGLDVSFLDGASRLAEREQSIVWDDSLDDYVSSGGIAEDTRKRWGRFLDAVRL